MANTLISPEEFAHVWGADTLVRVPEATHATIPQAALRFLAKAGLPALIRLFSGSTESKITFGRLALGLSRVTAEQTIGPPLSPEWSAYWILGDEFFCNGSAWWCADEQTGAVCRIDIELQHPISFANSSVAHFGAALILASSWSNRWVPSSTRWIDDVECFAQELQALDPASMQDEVSFWPTYV